MIWKRLKKPDPRAEERLSEEIERSGGLDKNDFLAMVISACMVILPAALIALLVVVLLCYLPIWIL